MVEVHERRYAIRPHAGHFSAGVTRDHRQVLMGLSCPNLVAFYFDLEGSLLTADQRPVHFLTPPYDIYDKRIPPLLKAWRKEMGFRSATIKVKKFFSAEHYIGIEDYPSHLHEILSDPAADEVEKADARESMELWDKDGQFVLLWGNDYWLDASGRVESS